MIYSGCHDLAEAIIYLFTTAWATGKTVAASGSTRLDGVNSETLNPSVCTGTGRAIT